jgi:hypothetical protein
MYDPNLPGEIQVTVTLKQVSVGTELNIVQEGLPDAIPLAKASFTASRSGDMKALAAMLAADVSVHAAVAASVRQPCSRSWASKPS